MTLHQHLPIYKLAVDLLDLAVDLTLAEATSLDGQSWRVRPLEKGWRA